MSDIFISYGNEDRRRVKPLVDALEQKGWTVWWDRTIVAGQRWDNVIEAELKTAKCVLVVWTHKSVKSEWVINEAAEARRRGVLIPTLLDEVEIPLEFKRVQTANLVDWPGDVANASFRELARAISKFLSDHADAAERFESLTQLGTAGTRRRLARWGALVLATIAGYALSDLTHYTQRWSASTWITLAAVVVGFTCLRALYSSADDNNPPRRWPLPGVISSIILVVVVEGVTWWYAKDHPVTTARQAFVALKENRRVDWLIRLVPYSRQTQPYLSIHEIKTLGAPQQKYVFVADYDELKNLTVADAMYRMGLSLGDSDSVSAMIFPLNRRDLYPANVRGVLQVIMNIDVEMKDAKEYRAFDITKYIEPSALLQLQDHRIGSWSWDGYSEFYEPFLHAVTEARLQRTSALNYMGMLGSDWNPLGYSEIISDKLKNSEAIRFELQTKTKSTVKAEHFGARAFLIENLALNDIDGLLLIHFSHINQERIPDLHASTP
jgi:hypothetical protein